MEKINKKIILALILLLAVISISAVSAIWPFDSGSDVTVNGVKFHLPNLIFPIFLNLNQYTHIICL